MNEAMIPLPRRVRDLLDERDAPPRLVAHLTLVHQVVGELSLALTDAWPNLHFDRQAVLLGAATHDIGKIIQRHELAKPGTQHERAGVALLRRYGFSQEHARFARTHGEWDHDPNPRLEDLMVALADTIWKGKRDDRLEAALVALIARSQAAEPWAVYSTLDGIIQPIAQGADSRLAWHGQHPT